MSTSAARSAPSFAPALPAARNASTTESSHRRASPGGEHATASAASIIVAPIAGALAASGCEAARARISAAAAAADIDASILASASASVGREDVTSSAQSPAERQHPSASNSGSLSDDGSGTATA